MRARARAIVLSVGLALPALVIAGQAASGCFWSFDDCTLTAGFGCKGASSGSAGVSTGGAGGTGGLGGASSTSMSGPGGGPACTVATAATVCPGPKDGPCMAFATRTCVAGTCGLTHMVMDAPSKKYGSCKKRICDGTGALMDLVDDTNVYDDGNPCTMESCSGGVSNEAALNDAACMIQGMLGYCEADPYNPALVACAQCKPTDQSTCAGLPGTKCSLGVCMPLHCSNGTKDLGEADTDCGGATSGCLRCATGRTCMNGAADCASGVCTMGKCVAPSCMDNVRNQDETGADCGGPTCNQPCPDGVTCVVGNDCLSGVCGPSAPGMPNKCQVPTCTDGVRNGDEAGVDCGGVASMCPLCGP